jgi:hypothetical protein
MLATGCCAASAPSNLVLITVLRINPVHECVEEQQTITNVCVGDAAFVVRCASRLPVRPKRSRTAQKPQAIDFGT